jgi:uncharacterized protein YjbI with pentapeptide repeats
MLKIFCLTGLLLSGTAHADDLNLRCRLEPGSACPWGNLEGAILDGMDLSDSSYKAVNLKNGSMKHATLVRLNLQTSNVSAARFEHANLSGSTFFAANAVQADFSDATLNGVNFTRADLTGANFRNASHDNMTLFIAAKLSGATWFDGRVCAPGSVGVCQ